mgnify:FL=1
MRRFLRIAIPILCLALLVGCLAGPNELAKSPDEEGDIAGFWKGLWHGIIAPLTFIISLFSRRVHFYEVHNNGNWYNLGFVLGAGILFGGGLFGRRSREE